MKCQDKTCCTCVNSSTCEDWKATKKELDKYKVVDNLTIFLCKPSRPIIRKTDWP